MAISQWRALPYWDHWKMIPFYQRWLQGLITARDFYLQHNEHRIVLTRLLVLVDFEAFRGQGYFLLVVILGSHVALGVLLGMIASEGCCSAATRAMVILASVAFLVSPVQLETLTWSFVTQYIHACLFAATSFWAIGKLATKLSARHEVAWTTLAAGSVAAGTLSNANGVIAAMIAGALTLLLPLRVLPKVTISRSPQWPPPYTFGHTRRHHPCST